MRARTRFLLIPVIVCAGAATACGGSPAKPTPPPTLDPPKITCPADVSLTAANGQPMTVAYGSATAILGDPPVIISCTPASGSIFDPGKMTMVTCTATDSLQRTDTCTFSVIVLLPPRISLTKFVAFGDSITWGEDGQSALTALSEAIRPRVQFPSSETYPGVLQRLLSARYTLQSPTVVNEGLPGEDAGDSTTLTRFTSVLLGDRPDAVLIMEGSNDVVLQLEEQSTAPVEAAIANLTTMVRDAKSRGVRPYLATIPPQNPLATVPARRGGAAAFVAPFNDRVRAVASAEGITLVDVYQAFNGDVTTLIGPDGLHPTAAGYEVIAETFFDKLKETLETAPPAPTLTAPSVWLGRTGSVPSPATAGRSSRPAGRRRR